MSTKKLADSKDVLKDSIQLIETPSKNTKRRILISVNVIFFLSAFLHMGLNILTFGKLPVPERDIPMYSFLVLWMLLSAVYNWMVLTNRTKLLRGVDVLSGWGTYAIVQLLALLIVHTSPNKPLSFLFDFSMSMVVIFIAGALINRRVAILSFVIALLSMFYGILSIGTDFEYHLSTKSEMEAIGKQVNKELSVFEGENAVELPPEQKEGIEQLVGGIRITSQWISQQLGETEGSTTDGEESATESSDGGIIMGGLERIGGRFQSGLVPTTIVLYGIIWIIFLVLVFFPIFFETGMLGEILGVLPVVIRNINEAAKEKQVLQKENMRMGAELDVAKQIQEMVLPKTKELENAKGLEVASRMDAATEVGGDYYEVLPQEDGSVYFGIGDVTDHGLQSGVIMLMTQSAYRACITQKNVKLTDCLISVNEVLYENIQTRMEDSRNLTLAFLHLQGRKIGIHRAA